MARLNDVYRCLASNDSISIATFDSSELLASPAAPWMEEKEIIYLVPNGSASVFSRKTLRIFFEFSIDGRYTFAYVFDPSHSEDPLESLHLSILDYLTCLI